MATLMEEPTNSNSMQNQSNITNHHNNIKMESKSSTNIITTKQIHHNYPNNNKNKNKRKIPYSEAVCDDVIPTLDSTKKTLLSESHGSISVIGRRRLMEDAVKVVPHFMLYGGCYYDFFAVYDGHGGTLVADACRDRLHLLLAEEINMENKDLLDWHKLMASCFFKMDMEISKGGNTMGSTAAVVVIGKEEIVVANCGDSRAVLSRGGVAVPLSRDHKPDREDEKHRIEAAGGVVIDWDGKRVLGVLATSRSIGDHCMKPFVISEPEINVYQRTELDEFVVVASDGLWDVVSNKCACQVVRSNINAHMKKKKNDKDECITSYAPEAAALLAELAMARGSQDNISVIVIQLNTIILPK
ncbi:hypothetical protein Lal_00007668 [Lupinus albus]|uniref:protein-serine/threonine phosphatase n=1 Tax=Lupinus albus TaxID=3870 RepID=A0A6A4NW14_LUPAL|nr:putative protein-serine/threonine phosphatase [Lupinus albus]KAF1875052.1 hypothetical protein Lal_00007668 [Lupinus albus]